MLLPTNAPPDVSIVIVSYNCRKLLLGCLASIQANVRATHEVIVVDSASSDGSAEAVRREHPDVRLYPFQTNVGFVGGNNFAFGVARGNYILMLNPDTLITEKTIDEMIQFMRRRPACAAVGPRLLGADGLDQNSAQRFPSVGGELQKTLGCLYRGSVPTTDDYTLCAKMSVAFKSDWVSGACMLMRTEAVRKLGVLEERFFMYYEEVDWCRRAATAGLEVWCLPRFAIIHFGSQSALASEQQVVGGNVLRFFQQSRYIYFKKHFGWCAAALVEACHFARGCVNYLKSFRLRTAEDGLKRRATAYAELRESFRLLLGLF